MLLKRNVCKVSSTTRKRFFSHDSISKICHDSDIQLKLLRPTRRGLSDLMFLTSSMKIEVPVLVPNPSDPGLVPNPSDPGLVPNPSNFRVYDLNVEDVIIWVVDDDISIDFV